MLDIEKADRLFNKVMNENRKMLFGSSDFPKNLMVNGVSYLITINYHRTEPGYYNYYYLNVMEGYKKDNNSTILNPLGFNDNELIIDDVKRKSKRQTARAKDFRNWHKPFCKALLGLVDHQLDPMWH